MPKVEFFVAIFELFSIVSFHERIIFHENVELNLFAKCNYIFRVHPVSRKCTTYMPPSLDGVCVLLFISVLYSVVLSPAVSVCFVHFDTLYLLPRLPLPFFPTLIEEDLRIDFHMTF